MSGDEASPPPSTEAQAGRERAGGRPKASDNLPGRIARAVQAEGGTIVLDFPPVKRGHDALPALAAELVRISVDVIVADSTSVTLAAFNAERRELHRNVAQHVVGNESIPASFRHDIIERTD